MKNIIGIDHIGINVPNMDSAVQFFSDVLGFEKVTEIGPFKLDEKWRKTYRIHPDADPEKIVSLRAGNGSNIELFEYKSTKSSKQQPYQDDVGWYHIALYTADINETVIWLKSKGIKVLSNPIVSSTGPTAGESWVYFLTPWGAQMELNSYPAGKGYEKTDPAIKLWSPKDGRLASTLTVARAEIENLVKEHLQAWGETDITKRNAILKRIYAPGINIVDRNFILSGHSKLNEFIDGLHKKHPGFVFSIREPIDSHHNIARLSWQFGPPSKPAEIIGQDVFVIENGQVQSMYIFVDTPGK